MFYVDDSQQTSDDQEKLFYSTLDQESYREYFEPFRSAQYRYVLSRLGVKPGARLLDVGASYGWMVQVGNDLGFDSFGVEPGDAVYDDRLKGRIFRGSLSEYWKTASGKFDVITIWHVLEHLRNPTESVQQMNDLLREGGTLVVAVPTTDGSMFQLALLLEKLGNQRLLNELFYFHNPNMHFFYPNERSLRLLLERFGFDVRSAETLESFDWTTIWKRARSPLMKRALKIGGPIVHWSRFTARENLVMIARKRSEPRV